MMEHLTLQNALLVLALLGVLLDVLRKLAPATKTTVDDAAVTKIDAAKAWAAEWAPTFWAVVEVAEKSGKLPPGASKAAHFLDELRAAWNKQNNGELPPQAIAVATGIASGISAGQKLPQVTATVAGNPPVAPGSK